MHRPLTMYQILIMYIFHSPGLDKILQNFFQIWSNALMFSRRVSDFCTTCLLIISIKWTYRNLFLSLFEYFKHFISRILFGVFLAFPCVFFCYVTLNFYFYDLIFNVIYFVVCLAWSYLVCFNALLFTIISVAMYFIVSSLASIWK